MRSSVSKVLEELRKAKVIGSSLDAHVTLSAPEEIFSVLKSYESFLCELFIVSQVTLKEVGPFSVTAERASGEKCVRCWNYSVDTGKDSTYPGICPKCVKALS